MGFNRRDLLLLAPAKNCFPNATTAKRNVAHPIIIGAAHLRHHHALFTRTVSTKILSACYLCIYGVSLHDDLYDFDYMEIIPTKTAKIPAIPFRADRHCHNFYIAAAINWYCQQCVGNLFCNFFYCDGTSIVFSSNIVLNLVKIQVPQWKHSMPHCKCPPGRMHQRDREAGKSVRS